MSEFTTYLGLGFDHILDIQGMDHMLFIIVLAVSYQIRDWKRVLALVTAFTIGHSITLALSTLEIMTISGEIIEKLIPVTILLTAILALFNLSKDNSSISKLNYLMALFFGLIHGLGFSNYLKALLGGEKNIVFQLLSFNLGLEVGQLIIILFYLLITAIFINKMKVNKRDWNLSIISAVIGATLIMIT
jgi:hypothetical protein